MGEGGCLGGGEGSETLLPNTPTPQHTYLPTYHNIPIPFHTLLLAPITASLEMSGFDEEEQQNYEDQMLTEVEVDDSAPLDDESEAGLEDMAVVMEYPPAPDLAFVTFSGHTDSVYCASLHPTQPGVVITGMLVPLLSFAHCLNYERNVK